MNRILPRLVLLVLVAGFAGYQYFSSETFTNDAGRKAHVGLSTEQETALGLQSYQHVLAHARTIESGPKHELVTRVAQRLAAATGESGAHFDWRVSLVESSEVNAFCLPGGKIVVYTGILPLTENEAGLATVLGHEMAHATARHGSERVLQEQAAQTLLGGVSLSLADLKPDEQRSILGAIGAGAQYGVLMPFGRKHESEADAIGLTYMARAGYDPHEALAFWKRMEEHGGEQPPVFLSTHPSHGARIAQLEALLPQALEIYAASQKR
jgi:predicted Zn-dependent protease